MERIEKSRDNSEFYRPELRRRLAVGAQALVLALGGAIGGVRMVDNVYDFIREDQSTTVEALPNREAENSFPNTTWLIVPGHNMAWKDSSEIAKALEPELEKTGQVHWAGYSNEGFDIRDFERTTLQYLRDKDLDNVALYGHSFGGMVSVELATFLHENGINVKEIVLDSTPSSIDDVRSEKTMVRFVAAGMVSPMARAVVGAAVEDGGTVTDYLRSNDTERTSAELLKDTSAYINNFDLDRFAGRLPEDITVTYIGSKLDAVIDTDTSPEAWERALPNHRIHYRDVTPAGHASPRGDTEVYLQALRPVTNRLIYDMCRSDEPGDTEYIEDLCNVEVAPDPAFDRAV